MVKIKEATLKLQKEIRKSMGTAILAAFAFIIALVWRDAIQEGVDKVIHVLGLSESLYFYKITTAVIVTIICVVGIMFFSKWTQEKNEK